LRTCLFKSLLGLAIGFVVGLGVGKYVVAFIQQPLLQALDQYYQRESLDRAKAESEDPEKAKEAKDRIEKEHLYLDEFYVDPKSLSAELEKEILADLKKANPDQFKDLKLPDDAPQSVKGDEGKLIPLPLWHRSADDPRLESKSLGTTEPFTVWVKASLLVGVLLASPWIFYQIWHFIAAGLYPHERRYVHMYLPFSLGLFLLGAALAFFVVFKPVLNFLLAFNRNLGIAPEPRISEWLNFVMILPVGFGIGFQLPLVMLFLERIGVFTVKSYLAQWRIAVLTIFIMAAILAPPDPYSMLLMAVPLTFLYFGGVLLCKMLPRRQNPYA
jgi:sec-independent protein translocase protein TatC